MKIFGGNTLALFVATIVVLGAAAQAMAQDRETERYMLDTVEVTAEKRTQNVQDIPAAISTMSADQIEDAGLEGSLDIIDHIPNLHAVKAGSHYGSQWLFIRGLSGTGSISGGHTVGVYVDGVYYPSGVSTELFDIERIEVLRGPQGTLYGRNTEAGVINIITKQPGSEYEGKASLGYGNYNSLTAKGAVGGPIVEDKLSARLSVKQYSSDGYFENKHTGDDRTDKLDDLAGRGQFLWTPTEDFNLTFSTDFTKFRDGFNSFALLDRMKENPHEVDLDYEGKEDHDSNTHMLKAVYQGDGFDVTSATSYRDWRYEGGMDTDFTAQDLYRTEFDNDVRTFSQELRVASQGSPSPLQWLVGAYAFNETKELDTDTHVRQGVAIAGIPAYIKLQQSEITSRGYALFGQGTYTFFDKLDVTAGLRYDRETIGLDYFEKYNRDLSAFGMNPAGREPEEISASEWLPKLAAAYRWTPDLMSYASVSKGYTCGGYNVYVGMANNAGTEYDPEYSWNYELGAKSMWLDRKLQVNASIFYIDWQDQQVSVNTANNDVIFKNAAESTSKGFELELLTRPLAGLELGGSFGYTDVTFDKYRDGTKNYDGNTNPFVPDYTYSLFAQYRHEAGWFGRVDVTGVGDAYFDLSNSKKQEAYELVGLRLGYEAELWAVQVWAKNLLDREYASRAIPSGANYIGRAGDPRTFGLTVSARF